MSNKKRAKRASDNEKTKKVKTVKESNKKEKKKKSKGKYPKLMLTLKILLTLFVLAVIVGGGVFAGIFFGLFGDDLKITAEDLNIKMENSVLVDLKGNEIATLNGEENREVIVLSEMGEYLPKAFEAIEDKRFRQHNGVDIKRTLGAVVKYITGTSSHGGSTITQQLIKNATGDNDRSPIRKVREISKAYQIEREMSKDQILEAYLNTIPLGGGGKNVYGVKVASKYYFDKEPTDLTLAQASYIAGINHSPNSYNPFKEKPNTENINKRTKTVLEEMIEQGKINKEQYDQAIKEVDEGLAFKEGSITNNNSLTQNEEEAVKQVAREYAKETGLDYKVALNKIKGGGYKIYITEDKEIQNRLEEEYKKDKYIGKGNKKDKDGNLINEQTQSSMTIIDPKTGYVVGCIGVLGEKTAYGLNRATSDKSTHSPGSSIKPIASIAPSLEERVITAASVLDDTPKSWGGYTPHNADWTYKGLLNIRKMIEVSANVPEVKLIQKLTPSKSIEYLKKFGLSYIDDEKDNGLALVLGGMTYGTNSLEMAGAYATIANGGEYIQPTFYTKVEDGEGKVILEATQEKRRVISEQNAYILQSILKEPVYGASGTGTKARIPGQEVRGKTGSTDNFSDRWFCGFTPYYAAATWFGYDETEVTSMTRGTNRALSIWQAVMKDIHKGLDSKGFTKPSGIVSATVCKDSGLLATDLCSQDPRGSRAYSEMFVRGTTPSKTCDCHVKLKICKETGKIANEFCKDAEEKVFITRPNSEKDTSWQKAADAQYMAPTETCDKHTKPSDTEKPVITVESKDTIEVKLNAKFTAPKATAKDNVDGDISKNIKTEIKKDGKVVKEIDTSKVGTYTITYTVTDTAKNTATKTITVKVVKDTGNTGDNGGNNGGSGNTVDGENNTITNNSTRQQNNTIKK